MMHRRPAFGNRVLVPRALAVISCALALLAAQPGMVQTPARARPTAIVADRADSFIPTISAEETERSSVARPQVARRNDTLFSSARRLHILATVEILQRLLIAELTPMWSHVGTQILLPAIDLQPIAIGLVDPPLTLCSNPLATAWQTSLPPPVERQFVLHHCLLAPPVS
jgi:hypothetical protein